MDFGNNPETTGGWGVEGAGKCCAAFLFLFSRQTIKLQNLD